MSKKSTTPSFTRVLFASSALTALVMTLLSWLSLAQMLFLSAAVWAGALEVRRRNEEGLEGDEIEDKSQNGSANKVEESDSDSDVRGKVRKSPLGSVAEEEFMEVIEREEEQEEEREFKDVKEEEDDFVRDEFQDVEEVQQPVVSNPSSSSTSPPALIGGIKRRSVRASGEELVRQLQELERNSRLAAYANAFSTEVFVTVFRWSRLVVG